MINSQKTLNQNTVDDLRNELFPKELVSFTGSYDAIVTRCIDKNRKGWIKVKVFGLTDDLPLKDQPWAEPAPMHYYQIPEPGAYVVVEFRDGDIHYPIWHSASSQNNGRFFTTHEYERDYPKNDIIYSSNEGSIVKNNKKTGEFAIEHSSGTNITINKDGDVSISGEGALRLAKKYKVVTGAAFCPFLTAASGVPTAHPTGSNPVLEIDDFPGV